MGAKRPQREALSAMRRQCAAGTTSPSATYNQRCGAACCSALLDDLRTTSWECLLHSVPVSSTLLAARTHAFMNPRSSTPLAFEARVRLAPLLHPSALLAGECAASLSSRAARRPARQNALAQSSLHLSSTRQVAHLQEELRVDAGAGTDAGHALPPRPRSQAIRLTYR